MRKLGTGRTGTNFHPTPDTELPTIARARTTPAKQRPRQSTSTGTAQHDVWADSFGRQHKTSSQPNAGGARRGPSPQPRLLQQGSHEVGFRDVLRDIDPYHASHLPSSPKRVAPNPDSAGSELQLVVGQEHSVCAMRRATLPAAPGSMAPIPSSRRSNGAENARMRPHRTSRAAFLSHGLKGYVICSDSELCQVGRVECRGHSLH